MSITPQVLSKLADLIPIAAGALIALAGGGIKYWVDRGDRRRQVRRDKLERILQLAHDLKDWTDLVDSRVNFETDKGPVTSPMEEMRVLGTMYFQDLQAEIQTVALAGKKYKQLALTLNSERRAAGGVNPPDANTRISAQYNELLDAISTLTDKATELARKLV